MLAIKVLLVEDNQVIRELLAVILRRAGHEVFTASDGVEGLQQFQLQQPDLLITDLIMPRMNGCELCKHVREISAVPTVLITGAILDDSGIDLVSGEVDAFLSKPFGSSELLAVIDSLFADGKHLKQRERHNITGDRSKDDGN